MDRKGKAIIFFLVLLSIFSLLIAAWGIISFQKEKSVRLVLSEKLQDIESKRNILEARLKEIEKKNGDLEVKLKESEDSISGLNQELVTAKESKDKAMLELDSIKEEFKVQVNSSIDLANRLKDAQSELGNLREQLKGLESTKVNLEEKVKELEKKTAEVNLEKIVVSSSEESSVSTKEALDKDVSQTAQPLEGKVLVVNKENAFAVINLGQSEGLKLRDVFSVYREDKLMGDVQVEELREHMSIVTYLSDDLPNKIRENDRVVRK